MLFTSSKTKSIVKFLTVDDIGSTFVNDAFKTDYIKNKYMFQCTDDINAVLNATFTKMKQCHQLSKFTMKM